MNKYEHYKKVDLPWLEEVPEHWEMGRIGRIFNLRKEKNNPIITKEILSLSAKYGVSLYSEKKEKGGNKPKEDLRNYNVCYPGDILVNCMNIVAGSVGISNYLGAVSPVYYPLVNQNFEQFSTRYMEYVLRTYKFQRSLVGLGKGIQMSESEDGRLFTVRMRISWDMLKTQLLPIPPLAEQEQIASYLDWKINEIDRLIAVEKEKIIAIEGIWEKAIDDSFDIFDSDELEKGIKLKNLVRQVTERGVEQKKFIALENIISKKGKLKDNFETLSDSNEGIAVKANMVIFGKLRPYLAKSIIVANDANCSPEFLVLDPIELTPKYLKYMMLSNRFVDLVNSSTYGTKMPRANSEFILNLRVNRLNVEKQEELVRKLELLESKVEKHVENSHEIISNLESLKNSLISEVVTGKIDVRNIVIPSYEKVDIADTATDEEEIEE